MIWSRKHTVSIADVFGDEPVPAGGADVIRYNQWSTPLDGFVYPPFHTVIIDLRQPEADLLAAVDKGTRYEIRRAQREPLEYGVVGLDGGAIRAFCDFYNRFAMGKGLAPADPAWLEALARGGRLVLTQIRREGEVLVWHAYVRDATSAILQFSCSQETADPCLRQVIGRANRYQHWKDLVYFREQGLEKLDLGGWYGGSEDQKLRAINKFKEEFGGRIIAVHNGMVGVSWKGKLAVHLLRIRALRRGKLQTA
jgi:hypothetical protein